MAEHIDPQQLAELAKRLDDIVERQESGESFATDIMRRISGLDAMSNKPKRISSGQAQRITNEITNNILFENTSGFETIEPVTLVSSGSVTSGTANVGAYVPSDTTHVLLEVHTDIAVSSSAIQVRRDTPNGWITLTIGEFTTVQGFAPLTNMFTFLWQLSGGYGGGGHSIYINLVGYVRKLSAFGDSSGSTIIGSTTFEGLADVNLTTPVANDLAIYDGSGNWVNAKFYEEVPSGAVNGVNATYTLAHTPRILLGVDLNGQMIENTVDFTISGAVITTTLTASTGAAVPQTGDRIRVRYIA